MTPQEVQALSDALRRGFNAEVEAESVDQNGRFRFAVVSPQFQQMAQLDRQDAVWKVIDEILPAAAALDISLILAFAPSELAPSGEPR